MVKIFKKKLSEADYFILEFFSFLRNELFSFNNRTKKLIYKCLIVDKLHCKFNRFITRIDLPMINKISSKIRFYPSYTILVNSIKNYFVRSIFKSLGIAFYIK